LVFITAWESSQKIEAKNGQRFMRNESLMRKLLAGTVKRRYLDR